MNLNQNWQSLIITSGCTILYRRSRGSTLWILRENGCDSVGIINAGAKCVWLPLHVLSQIVLSKVYRKYHLSRLIPHNIAYYLILSIRSGQITSKLQQNHHLLLYYPKQRLTNQIFLSEAQWQVDVIHKPSGLFRHPQTQRFICVLRIVPPEVRCQHYRRLMGKMRKVISKKISDVSLAELDNPRFVIEIRRCLSQDRFKTILQRPILPVWLIRFLKPLLKRTLELPHLSFCRCGQIINNILTT